MNHIPPEKLDDHTVDLNEKSDAYSYAILIWELYTDESFLHGVPPGTNQ